MSYQIIYDSLRSSYNWLFGIFFPRIFAFIQNNELVSVALIITFVLPLLLLVFHFFNIVSFDSESLASKKMKSKYITYKKDKDNEQRKMIYNNRNNIYHQAYLKSIYHDKK